MSHIPNSAMKHAGPAHHDEADRHPHRGPDPRPRPSGIGTGAWIAIGGTLLVGAAAAVVVPLLKARTVPVAKRGGKRASAKRRHKSGVRAK